MRALRAHGLDGPSGVHLDDVPDAHTGRGATDSVRVAVRAAGVGFADTLLARGQFDSAPTPPFVLGLEFSGEVISAPAGSGYCAGDRVIGHVMTGGFAEVVLARPDMLAPLPEGLSFVEGAGSVVNFHTALIALWRRAQLCAGESVLVHGAGGGLGSALVQIATALGARVVAVASSPAHRSVARAAGARDVCTPDDWFDAVRAAGGVDVVVDPVGGDTFEQSIGCLAPEGRLITVGAVSEGLGKVAADNLLRTSCSVMGLLWPAMVRRDRSLFARTAKQIDDLIATGLRPIVTKTYELSEGVEALRALENRTASGKLVITVG
jgi:NADPH2:quinone reductase